VEAAVGAARRAAATRFPQTAAAFDELGKDRPFTPFDLDRIAAEYL
jgi:hypothetical protein